MLHVSFPDSMPACASIRALLGHVDAAETDRRRSEDRGNCGGRFRAAFRAGCRAATGGNVQECQ